VAILSRGASLVNRIFRVFPAFFATPAVDWLEEEGLQRWMSVFAIAGIVVASASSPSPSSSGP
jgi:hypothetical protein